MNKKTIIKTLIITGVIMAMLSTVALCSDKGKGGNVIPFSLEQNEIEK